MKDGSRFARAGVMDLQPYVPGKPIEEVAAEFGLTEIYKLASNENPLSMSPKSAAAVQAEIPNCHFYPEGESPIVRKKLAKHWGVAENQICFGTGGDHVLTLIGNAFINQGDEVIVGAPSFYTYNLSTWMMGGTLVKVPLDANMCYDLEAILAAVTPRTKLIFFCNPNNPTGTIVRREEVADFMARLPDHCVVVFDEAYFEFVQDQNYPDGIEEYVKTGANVIVLRTFSKIYGLAGLRIGYAIAAEHLAPVLSRVVPPFPVNRLAQAAAAAALDDTEHLQAVINNNETGRAYLNAEFAKMGLKFAESHGNFIFVDVEKSAQEVNQQLLQRGFIIRPGTGWGFPNHIRVSIGLPEANEKFIAALKEILQK